MIEKSYFLHEVEALTGIPITTLQMRCVRGRMPGAFKDFDGAKQKWKIHDSALQKLLKTTESGEYSELFIQWKQEMASGAHTSMIISQGVIAAYERAMNDYWNQLALKPSIKAITVDNLRQALASLVEPENCHYAMRKYIFYAFTSFYKLLIRCNHRNESDLNEIRKLRPKRYTPAKRGVVSEDQVLEIIKANKSHIWGKTNYDVSLNHILLMLYIFAGLRRNEAILLKIEDIDFQNKEIRVLGKGRKYRIVPLFDELAEDLRTWLSVHRPASKSQLVMLTQGGEPLNAGIVNKRMQRLSDHIGIDFSPHYLRRAFATIASNRGVDVNSIRLVLGHSDLRTTQIYIQATEKQALQNFHSKFTGIKVLKSDDETKSTKEPPPKTRKPVWL